MKILHIFPYLPTPATFGGAMRIFHILEHLSENHDVTVAGYNDTGDLALFQRTFPQLQGKMHFLRRSRSDYHRLYQLYSLFTSHSYWYNWAQSRKFEQSLNQLTAESDFDIILSEFATMGHFDLETDAIRILDAHNVEYDNFRRMSLLEWSPVRKKFYEREYRKCYQEEVDIFNKQDVIFATSRRDSEIISENAPGPRKFVIPNGVDTEFFTPGEMESNEEPYSMVFTGTMSYVPNCDGMVYFLENIFPLIQKVLPSTKVYIVGSNPPPMLKKYESENVHITGFVEDVRPYIKQAGVYIVPLNMGSGTRLKVVEALSMKIPIVSTSIGSEGIDIEDGIHLLIRDKPEEFADAVISLMKKRDLRRKLIDNGYELVKRKYDWKIIGNSLEEAFHSSLNETGLEQGELDSETDVTQITQEK